MRPFLDFVILMFFASTYSAAAIAWSVAVLYLWKTIANRRPEVRLWSAALGYVPLNIVFRPELLTERGRLCRRRFGVALLAFVVAVSAGLAMNGILGLLSK
jgi:hypothetical protein